MASPGFFHIGTDPAIEVMFSLVVIVACFLIYFKTKELYDLSGHKGIKYFRNIFLFFGLSYITRIFFKSCMPFFIGPVDTLWELPFVKIFGALSVYFSSAMFVFLILSFLWKRLEGTIFVKPWFTHGLPILIAVITAFQKIPFIFLIFQSIAFVSVIFLLIKYRKRVFHKQNPWVIATYAMVFGHWILIGALEVLSIFFPMASSMIYIITLCFFVVLLDRFWLHFSKHKTNLRGCK